ncbi:hypothetical protein [Taibaiella koreensis]|uniref:hypothetical protein n=1 Tax=Taibaiella koreensis TaxID=1268548 RepID=UPI000E59FC4A|nr:hypothetical protein [Taibaiella koreensis]
MCRYLPIWASRCGVLLLLQLLFWSGNLPAQQLLDLGKVDIVAIKKGKGTLLFYQKTGKQYKEVVVGFGTAPGYTPSVRIDSMVKTMASISDSGTVLLPVKHIRSYSSVSFYAYLSGNQFGARKEPDNADTIFTSLQPGTPSVMLVRETTKWVARQDENGTIKEWDTDDRYFPQGFCLLRLDKDKYAAIFDRDQGYLIPCRDGDRLFIYDFFPGNSAGHAPADKSWQRDASRTRKVFESADRSIQQSYYDLDTQDDHYRLTGDFNLPLLPGTYDEIERGATFIFARKGKSIEVYNYFLQLLVADARSYTVSGPLAFVLTGNTVVTLDNQGIVGPDQKYIGNFGAYQRYDPSNYWLDRKDSTKPYFLFTIHRDPFLKQKNPIVPDTGLRTDELIPLCIRDLESSERYQWLAIRKGMRYGLYRLPEPEWPDIDPKLRRYERDTFHEGRALIPKQLLPVMFDSIVPLKHGDFFKIYRNGLGGIYPIQQDAVYTSMTVWADFIRFTLPGGKKGWLNLKTKTEFMDE